MTTTTQSKLSRTFQHLLVECMEDEDVSHTIELGHGARVSLMVSNGDCLRLWLSRKDALVGATEIKTFRKHFGIPDDAEHTSETEQKVKVVDGQRWNYVLYKWRNA